MEKTEWYETRQGISDNDLAKASMRQDEARARRYQRALDRRFGKREYDANGFPIDGSGRSVSK